MKKDFVKEQRQTLNAVEADMRELQGKVATIQRRAAELDAEGAALESQLRVVQDRKAEVLARFAMGEASEQEMSSARKAVTVIEVRLSEIREVSDATRVALEKLKAEVPRMERRFSAAKNEFWRALRETEAEELRDLVGTRLLRILAMNALAGAGTSHESATQKVFFPLGSHVMEVQEVMKELENEILGKA